MKRRFQRLEDSCRTKRRRLSGSVLEVFTLTTELVNNLVEIVPHVVGNDVNDAEVVMTDSSKKGREKVDNAQFERAFIIKPQAEMEEGLIMKIYRLRDFMLKKLLRKEYLDWTCQKILARECDEAVSRPTWIPPARDSATARYNKLFAVLRGIVEAGNNYRNKLANTFVKIRKVFAQDSKAGIATHPAELD